jgi:putative FmdB family regulatory protein
MTYEYVCAACRFEWEAEQPISAAPLKTCPSCGKDMAKRQVSGGGGFILKGGGWYADGYGSPKPKSEEVNKPKAEESKKPKGDEPKPSAPKPEKTGDSAPEKPKKPAGTGGSGSTSTKSTQAA